MGFLQTVFAAVLTALTAGSVAPTSPPAAGAGAAQVGWCSHEDSGWSVECTLADQDGAWTCTCTRGKVVTTCTQSGGINVNACEFHSCCE